MPVGRDQLRAASASLAHNDPDLLFALVGQVVARLKRTTRKVSDLAFLDVTGRIGPAHCWTSASNRIAMFHPDGMQIRIEAARRSAASWVAPARWPAAC